MESRKVVKLGITGILRKLSWAKIEIKFLTFLDIRGSQTMVLGQKGGSRYPIFEIPNESELYILKYSPLLRRVLILRADGLQLMEVQIQRHKLVIRLTLLLQFPNRTGSFTKARMGSNILSALNMLQNMKYSIQVESWGPPDKL